MPAKRDVPAKVVRAIKASRSGKSIVPLPVTPDGWLREIAAAYADAHEAIPFGPLVGATFGADSLFHLAPSVCLKLRGITRSKKTFKAATEAALASYVAMQGSEPELVSRPHIAFAFCYLAAHFGLDIIAEDQVAATMDFIVSEEKRFDRMIEEAIKAR